MNSQQVKRERVLAWLQKRPGTVDEFICETGLYINSWAPVFTHLYKDGLIRPDGQRVTSHGGVANVWVVA